MAYSRCDQGGLTETGAQSLNLGVHGHSADPLVYGIGFSLETPLQLSRQTRLIPRLSVAYEHDVYDGTNEPHQVTASYAEVPANGPIDLPGQNLGANDLNVALNVELETSDQFSLLAGVGGSFRSNVNALSFGGIVRWRFVGAPRAPSAPTTRGLW